MVVLAIGFGAFLLATLFLVQQNLLNELDVSSDSAERPNFVFFDVQPDQFLPLDTILEAAAVDRAPPVPIVPMRILSLRGTPVSVMLADTTDSDSAPRGWTLRREYRSTYRDSLTDSERLIEGRWWSGDSVPVEISVEQELALDLGVELGDEIVWDVQGVPLPSRVRSIRTVDWARFEPNFFVVFAPGALERAPHSIVTLARIEDPALRGRLQRVVAERFPNVTSLDLTMLQAAIEQLVGRVSLAIRFMALFSLVTGVLVLVGAVATSRYQRVREGALLKTLGATRGQVLRVVFAEYLALGLLAATAAVGLSAAAGWALARFMFEVPFAFPVEAIAGVIGLTSLLTVGVGVWGSVEVIRKTPLEVLRAEAA
jgi:putative ABC transport system permease protein